MELASDYRDLIKRKGNAKQAQTLRVLEALSFAAVPYATMPNMPDVSITLKEEVFIVNHQMNGHKIAVFCKVDISRPESKYSGHTISAQF